MNSQNEKLDVKRKSNNEDTRGLSDGQPRGDGEIRSNEGRIECGGGLMYVFSGPSCILNYKRR